MVYLGRYLYRGMIQEKDIIRCEDGQVTYRYRDSKTRKMALRTVSGASFLWLLMQHLLPKGFRRARNFGFLHPGRKGSAYSTVHVRSGYGVRTCDSSSRIRQKS